MGWDARANRGATETPAYANVVTVGWGGEQVLLTFVFQRSEQDTRVIGEIVLHPDHAARLATLLARGAPPAPAPGAPSPERAGPGPVPWTPPGPS